MMINKLWVLLIIMMLIGSGNVWATVSGQCSNCHTMHNSQGGVLDTTKSGATIPALNRSLTKGDCVGCHTGTIANSSTDHIPYVLSSGGSEYGPDYDGSGSLTTSLFSLAGGTFNFVDDSTANGHNVVGISGTDAMGLTPPGWVANTFYADDGTGADIGDVAGNDTTSWSSQLTCAGTYGCHGNHAEDDDFADIRGAHHGDDTTIDGKSVAKSYRFLRGILGYEDGDWELTVSDSDHNTYYGVDRTTTSTDSMNGKTISYLCAECHGLFHSNDGQADTVTALRGVIDNGPSVVNTNPWLRHPTDFSLKSTDSGSEYLSYASAVGAAAEVAGVTAVYNYIAPLASANVTADPNNNVKVSATTPPSGAITNPFTGSDNDIVTCLSCHRAHGSKYPDLLRWDYTKMQAGAGAGFANKGCFACHTSKD